MSTAPLYEIVQGYRAALETLADADVDAQTVADTVEGLQGDLLDKLRAVIAYGLEQQAQQEMQAAAAKRMAERAKATGSRADSLLTYALRAMQDAGIPSVQTDEWAAKPAKTPGRIVIDDDATLPPEYLRIPPAPEPAPDKDAIKRALSAGVELPGVRLVTGWRMAIR
jgi:hypothetical protein